MNRPMFPARPDSSSPAAKMPTPQGSATRGPRRSPASPPATMPTTEATRKALNGQPYQASPSSSATAVGIAVPTAMASKAMKVISISRPTVVPRSPRSKTPAGLLASTLLANSFHPPLLPGHASSADPSRDRRSTSALGPRAPWCALAGGDLLGGGRDDGVQVAHDTEVGQLEDRGLGVLVDGHDGLRGLHAGAVLDRPGDADGDVELRRDGLAGLPHLEGVRVEAGVHRGPGGADGRDEAECDA